MLVALDGLGIVRNTRQTKHDSSTAEQAKLVGIESEVAGLALACENSRPSSLPARVAFWVKDVCDSPPKIPY